MSQVHFPPPPDDQQASLPPPDSIEEAPVVGGLKRLYQPQVDQNARSLERVRARLAAQRALARSSAQASQPPHARRQQGYVKENIMQPGFPRFLPGSAWRRGIGTIAAVVVLAVLVGSMVAVFTLGRSGKGAPGVGVASPTGTPSASPTGSTQSGLGYTVYTSPPSLDSFYAFAWSPDSQRLAVSTQSMVQIWAATAGNQPPTYKPGDVTANLEALCLAWSPDGKELAVPGVGSGLEIINPLTGALIHNINPPITYQQNGPGISAALSLSGGSGVSAAAWSPDGKLLAAAFFGAGGNTVTLWNAQTGAWVASFAGQTNQISSLAWSSDSAYLASTNADGMLDVWNVQTKQMILSKRVSAASGVAWSPSGLQLVFASDDNTWQVWDMSTQTLISSYHAQVNAALAWSPNGTAIAVGSNNDVMLWNAATGKHIYTYTQNGGYVRALAWSPDGKYIVSGANFPASGSDVRAYAKIWLAAPLT